jgi:hypothetical protein
MPWVSRHRRRVPGRLFGTTTVRSHYRRRPGGVPLVGIVGIVVAVLVILVLIAVF